MKNNNNKKHDAKAKHRLKYFGLGKKINNTMGQKHFHLPAFFLEVPRCPEHLLHGPWDHPLPNWISSISFHGVGFSGPRLAIGEYADVITVQSGLYQLRNFTEDVFLIGRWSEHLVEREFIL